MKQDDKESRNQDFKIQEFKAYQTVTNSDGTIRIQDVEIFELGKHKGFDYNAEWAAKALKNHDLLSQGGFFPSAIIGHNNDKEEKPARGRLANFRLDGKYIKADIDKVQPDIVESLKKGEYPHRSVEVNPDEARFTALALLGGTSPYHKLPNLELFGGDPEAVVIPFQENSNSNRDEEAGSLMQKFDELISKMKSLFDNKPIKSNEEEDNNMSTVKLSDEQKTQFAEEFKKLYGLTPDEAVERYKKFQEDEKNRLETARENRIKAFAEKLKKESKIAPKLVDEKLLPFLNALPANGSVKFSEGNEKPAIEAFQEVFESFLEAVKKEELFFDDEEKVTGVNFEQFENKDNVEKLHKKASDAAKKAVAEGKFKSFHEAYNSIIMSIVD